MSKLFTPMSLIAEYAGDNASSSITILEKEESLTSVFLAHEYAISKAENEYKMATWKLMMENQNNPYVITEGVLSAIADFFKRIFEAIASLFNKQSSSTAPKLTETEVKEKVKETIKKANTQKDILSEKSKETPDIKKSIKFENIHVARLLFNGSAYKAPDYNKYLKTYESTLVDMIQAYEHMIYKYVYNRNGELDEEYMNEFANKFSSIVKRLEAAISEMNTGGATNTYVNIDPDFNFEYTFKADEYKEKILAHFRYKEFQTVTYKELEDARYIAPESVSESIAYFNSMKYPTSSDIKRIETNISSQLEKLDRLLANRKNDGDLYNSSKRLDWIKKVANYGMSALTASVSAFKKIESGISTCRTISTANGNRLGSKNESASIHGVEIDSSSLFDDDIMRDFNTSTWMDLALESNYSLMKKSDEIDLERYYRECVALARPVSESVRIDEIRSINEAVAKKLGGFVKNAIDVVKKLFSKFIETLTANLRSNKAYLDKYRKVILTQTPKHQQIKMKDCFEAIKRITSADIPPFDYNQVKDRFDTEEDVQKWIKEKLPVKNDTTLNGIEDFATWCKAYFCIAEESPIKVYEMSNSNSVNMTDIFNFCHDNTKITNQCKTMLNNLEKNANNIAAAAEVAATNLSNQQNTPQEQNASAVYSFVYGRPITEVEVVKNDNAGDSANTPTGNTASDNMPKNATDNDPNTASDNIKSAGTNEELQAIKNKTTNYIKTVKTFFAADLTAIEFVQKEFMSIVRMHVKNFVNDETQGSTAKSVGTDYKKK